MGRDSVGIPYKNTIKVVKAVDRHFHYRYSELLANQLTFSYYNLALAYRNEKKISKSQKYAKKATTGILKRHPYLTPDRIFKLLAVILSNKLESKFLK
jgi:hypothetical protein